ncbi:unnamed protein product, partial [Ostreobium quekettii]
AHRDAGDATVDICAAGRAAAVLDVGVVGVSLWYTLMQLVPDFCEYWPDLDIQHTAGNTVATCSLATIVFQFMAVIVAAHGVISLWASSWRRAWPYGPNANRL